MMAGRLTPLKLELLQQGRLQADLAADAHIHRSRLCDILNGRITPNTDERVKLAKVLGRTEKELFGWIRSS
jgi:transcriptional regulator with XRE-family HTH domain